MIGIQFKADNWGNKVSFDRIIRGLFMRQYEFICESGAVGDQFADSYEYVVTRLHRLPSSERISIKVSAIRIVRWCKDQII